MGYFGVKVKRDDMLKRLADIANYIIKLVNEMQASEDALVYDKVDKLHGEFILISNELLDDYALKDEIKKYVRDLRDELDTVYVKIKNMQEFGSSNTEEAGLARIRDNFMKENTGSGYHAVLAKRAEMLSRLTDITDYIIERAKGVKEPLDTLSYDEIEKLHTEYIMWFSMLDNYSIGGKQEDYIRNLHDEVEAAFAKIENIQESGNKTSTNDVMQQLDNIVNDNAIKESDVESLANEARAINDLIISMQIADYEAYEVQKSVVERMNKLILDIECLGI